MTSSPLDPSTPHKKIMLRVISAGAAKGLIQDLEAHLCKVLSAASILSHPSSLQLNCTFGAVGAMKDIFLAEIQSPLPPDCAGVVMISSQSILSSLVETSLLDAASLKPIGWVSTAMARLEGDSSIHPMHEEEALREALLKAPAIYAPDTEQSTAGIHFKKVLIALDLWPTIKDRVQNFPNGAAAMGQMAKDQIPGALGCTQVTEINYTPGVEVISLLPQRFELNTLYSAARAKAGADVALASAFIDLIGDEDAKDGSKPDHKNGDPVQKARLEGGFHRR